MPPTRKRNLSVGDDITILSTSKKCKNKVQSNAIDHAINSVISQSQPCPPSPPPIDNGKATSSKVDKGSSISKMQTEISHLQSVIATQSKEIARLTHQLSVVMTYLEIGDGPVVPVPVPVGGAGSTGNDSSTDVPGVATAAATHPVHQSGASSTAPAMIGDGNVHVARPSTAREAAVTAAVAAVYVEQSVKKRRASTLIVSGLPVVNSATDQQQFVNLCQREFHMQPDVVHTRRLGQVRPGRVQPLLVALRTEEAATQLLGQARRLRQSADDDIRANVYMNANLTRAEATAAFQLRQQRREKRQSSSSSSSSGASAGTAAAVVQSGAASTAAIVASSSNTAVAANAVAAAGGTAGHTSDTTVNKSASN